MKTTGFECPCCKQLAYGWSLHRAHSYYIVWFCEVCAFQRTRREEPHDVGVPLDDLVTWEAFGLGVYYGLLDKRGHVFRAFPEFAHGDLYAAFRVLHPSRVFP